MATVTSGAVLAAYFSPGPQFKEKGKESHALPFRWSQPIPMERVVIKRLILHHAPHTPPWHSRGKCPREIPTPDWSTFQASSSQAEHAPVPVAERAHTKSL